MKFRTDYAKMKENILRETKEYIAANNIQALVIGLSGGIDSALVAALASECGVPVIGRCLPIETNSKEETARGTAIGLHFCQDFATIDMTRSFRGLYDPMENYEEAAFYISDDATEDEIEFGIKIRRGNVKARVRMIQLYHIASMYKGLVLSTDNLTELALGFWTLHGDVGDYGMIQQLWKTEVYGLAKFMADEYRREAGLSGDLIALRPAEALYACIDATPTDGLGITNSDLDQLGVDSYAEVDCRLLAFCINKNDVIPGCPVIKRHNATKFKRDNPFNIPREVIVHGVSG